MGCGSYRDIADQQYVRTRIADRERDPTTGSDDPVARVGRRQGARELRLARNSVRSNMRLETETKRRYERREQPMSQLGAYVAQLDELLAANVKRQKRERLTYQRTFEELRVAGYRCFTIFVTVEFTTPSRSVTARRNAPVSAAAIKRLRRSTEIGSAVPTRRVRNWHRLIR